MDQTLVAQAQACLRDGQAAQALQALAPALAADAQAPQALKLLLRLALQLQQMPLAAQALRAGMARMPGDAELHALAAAGARIMGHGEGLERSARRALQLDPAQPLAAALLAERLGDRLAFTEALDVADRCLAARPREWAVLLARANLHLFAGDAQASVRDAEAAARDGQSLQAMQAAASGHLYLDATPASAVMARHRALAERIPPLSLPAAEPASPDGWPLRVGLLSPDLRRHPVGELVEPLLRGHDRQRLQLFCYQDGAADAQTARLHQHVPEWREVSGLPDDALAQRMREDRIDVLLDLAGHTAGSRPRLLASRVAPRQFGYLGYLFDTALPGCDGVIGDRWNLPEGTDCARNALRLAGSFLCFAPPVDAPEVASREESGGTITFASFNHLAKLSPATVSLWARVLDAVPNARLRLCALGLADAGLRERIAARFAAQGVDPSRLELRPPVFETQAFLRQYDDVDIALDPLPFGGGMSTLQALWQGVPVLSVPGERMAARSGLSILSAVGLHDCIAQDADGFVRLAAEWAADAGRRHALRRELRARMQDRGLTDARRFAAGFADLLERAVSEPASSSG